MGEISEKVTLKNKDNTFDETLTNSAEFGIISQNDFFDKEISNRSNLNGYYVVENNNFVLDTTSVEVDKDKKEISSTEQTEHVVTPILLYNNTESFISLYAYNYKAHTETFNLKFDKWTLRLVWY